MLFLWFGARIASIALSIIARTMLATVSRSAAAVMVMRRTWKKTTFAATANGRRLHHERT
jgi:hypothetical protein